MDVFSLRDYKEAIHAKLAEKKRLLGNRFTYEKLARRIGVQQTYLSRVLGPNGPHLSEDQLYRIASDLGFGHDERRFLQLLLERDRSEIPERLRELTEEIDRLARTRQRSEAYLSVETTPNSSELLEYFLNPDVPLAHMFLTVKRFRDNVPQIASKLGITDDALNNILATLERQGMVALVDGSYEVKLDQTHLSADSALFGPYRAMQHMRAMERFQKLPLDRTYNFTVVFSATEAARLQIKTEFLEFLKKVENIVQNAPDEDVFQMSFDLFDWSR